MKVLVVAGFATIALGIVAKANACEPTGLRSQSPNGVAESGPVHSPAGTP